MVEKLTPGFHTVWRIWLLSIKQLAKNDPIAVHVTRLRTMHSNIVP